MKSEDANDILLNEGADSLRTKFDHAACPQKQIDWPEMKGGAPVGESRPNVRAFFDFIGVKLRYSLLSYQAMTQRPGQLTTALTDDALRAFWLDAHGLGLKAKKGFFTEAVLDLAYRNQYHPIRNYLDGLAWDGVSRIDRWLIDLAGAEDTPLVRTISRKFLLAAVRRVRQPGCKFDAMLVLVGPQGAGKSSIVSILGGEWTTDCLTIGDSPKVVMEQTQGVWFVELAELAQANSRESETIKAMISRQADKARTTYAKLASEARRQFVMIATVNSLEFLKDATGNRRYLPVRIFSANLPAIREIRDQLLAEASEVEAAGEALELPVELRQEAALAQEQYRQTDPWEETLRERVGSRKGFFLITEALRTAGVDPGQQNSGNQKRMVEILNRLGFEKCRRTVSGTRVWVYSNQSEGEAAVRIALS